jgi:peptidoglycan hydrolase-like protein with peptidoglycan-binding domain
MHTWRAVLIAGVLGLGPGLLAAGTTGPQVPGQQQIITKENFKLIQERLQAEGVYAGPIDGEWNAQTAAALRRSQEKQGVPVSGEADEATLRQLQIHLPTTRQGEGGTMRPSRAAQGA